MQRLVITIARSYGSGGRTLGKKLAEELGIHCYDRELIRMASDASGINEAMFGKMDESLKSLPIFSIAKKNHNGEVFPPDSDQFTSDENLFRYQAKVIRELADTESCIIIGRAADYILKDRDGVLKLFFYASKENCVKRLVAQEGISTEEAYDRIQKRDRYRANYYKYYTGNEWYDAHNYDFCIDTAAMSYEKLISVVKNYIWNRFSEEKKSARRPAAPAPAPAPIPIREAAPIRQTAPDPVSAPIAPTPERAPARTPVSVPIRRAPNIIEEESEPTLGIKVGMSMGEKLEAFLDTKSVSEKYQILRTMRDEIDDRLIDDMAASLDIVIEGRDTMDKYEKLKNALAMRTRYELTRYEK